MASSEQVKIILVSEDNASASIKDATQAVKDLGAESKKITKGSKKDWGGLGDLFGKILPRNLQSLMRGFKGTQRQVGRLAKGFKALKAAWASIGIGLILIALEELISNWDTVSDAIMGVTAEQKRQEKVTKDVYLAQVELNSQVKSYIENIANVELGEKERAIAIQEVNSRLGDYIDLNATVEEQAEQANILLAANKAAVAANIASESQRNKEKEKTIELSSTELTWGEEILVNLGLQSLAIKSKVQSSNEAYKDIKDAQKDGIKFTKEELEVRADLESLLDENIKRKAEAAEADKKSAEAAREAEAARKRSQQSREADEKWLANERVRIAEEASLRLIADDEKREKKALEIQHQKAREELVLKQGTWQDLMALEEEFEVERKEITDRFAAEKKAQEDQDKLDAEADALELKTQLQTDQQNELDALAIFFEEKRALVQGDMEQYIALVKQEKEEEKAVNDKYNKGDLKSSREVLRGKMLAAVKWGNAIRGVVGGISDIMDENAKEQKALAITEVLLSQAVSIASAIAGATSAGSSGGPAAPVITPLLVIQMVGSVLAGFAGVKNILNQAGAQGGGGGGVSSGSFGGGGGSSVASMAGNVQVPLPARLDSPDAMQAYVVQSQLDGQMQSQQNLQGQIVL